METINNIELRDESIYPDDVVLRKALGASYETYLMLLSLFNDNDMSFEWRYYRDGKAWLCKVQKKKRTIIWMSAWKGFMKATIYFPHKFLERVYELGISEDMKERIRSTKDVGKSKPCNFEIRDKSILGDFEKVMQLKVLCK
ncbi:MAG: DUF3788 family protein [Spirochaetales bacterium]|nr:DUF3788 family protein [Spirochaetales bacterium]